MDIQALQEISRSLRRDVVEMVYRTKDGHPAPASRLPISSQPSTLKSCVWTHPTLIGRIGTALSSPRVTPAPSYMPHSLKRDTFPEKSCSLCGTSTATCRGTPMHPRPRAWRQPPVHWETEYPSVLGWPGLPGFARKHTKSMPSPETGNWGRA